jgi:hypothetical protein
MPKLFSASPARKFQARLSNVGGLITLNTNPYWQPVRPRRRVSTLKKVVRETKGAVALTTVRYRSARHIIIRLNVMSRERQGE